MKLKVRASRKSNCLHTQVGMAGVIMYSCDVYISFSHAKRARIAAQAVTPLSFTGKYHLLSKASILESIQAPIARTHVLIDNQFKIGQSIGSRSIAQSKAHC